MTKNELSEIPNLGESSYQEILTLFATDKIYLGDKRIKWKRPNIKSILKKPIPSKNLHYLARQVIDKLELNTLGDLSSLLWKDMINTTNASFGTHRAFEKLLLEHNLFFGINGFKDRTPNSEVTVESLVGPARSPFWN